MKLDPLVGAGVDDCLVPAVVDEAKTGPVEENGRLLADSVPLIGVKGDMVGAFGDDGRGPDPNCEA